MINNLKQLLIGSYKANKVGLAKLYKHYKAKPLYVSYQNALGISRNEYEIRQKKALLLMLNYATKYVPYYAERRDIYSAKKYEQHTNAKSILMDLPLLNKKEVRAHVDRFYSNQMNLKTRLYSTGGTTGSPLKVRHTIESLLASNASLERLFSMAGVNARDRCVCLTGFFAPGLKSKGSICWRNYIGNSLFMSMYHLNKEYSVRYSVILDRFKPRAYFGYASAIYLLACMFKSAGIIPPKTAIAAFTTAEILYPNWREEIESVLGVKVYNQYGSQEGCAIAYDCKKGNMHITPECGIIEVVDSEGKTCQSEREGEIVLTSLINKAMPLIRYKVGDMGTLEEDHFSCSCGLKWPVLKEISGRSEDIIWTPEGRPVTQLSVAIRYCKGLEQCQIIQDSIGHMKVLLVVSSLYSKKSEDNIEKEILRRSGYPYKIDFEYVKSIPRIGRGKYKVVVDLVDNNAGNGSSRKSFYQNPKR